MKEQDIRPEILFSDHLRLIAEDAAELFDMTTAELRPCPGCGDTRCAETFTKNGFRFVTCDGCGTLFANPLPTTAQFERYYREGRAARHWAEVFLPAVIEARGTTIVTPRVKEIGRLAAARGLSPRSVLDVGAAHGAFLAEWQLVHGSTDLFAVEPNPTQAAICRRQGFKVLESTGEVAAEIWSGVADLATSFEVLEHVPDPVCFVQALFTMLQPSGLAVVTTLGCEGFDIQTLWAEARAVSPPSHLNFPTIAGFEAMFRRAGFQEVEVLTPGRLDVEIVQRALKRNPDLRLDRFTQTLLARDEAGLADFQRFLVESRLSSHVWIVAQKASDR